MFIKKRAEKMIITIICIKGPMGWRGLGNQLSI